MTTSKRSRRNGQTMVEYIIIVVLIGKLSKATGKKVAGATSALDEEVGSEAASLADQDPADKIKSFGTDGNF